MRLSTVIKKPGVALLLRFGFVLLLSLSACQSSEPLSDLPLDITSQDNANYVETTQTAIALPLDTTNWPFDTIAQDDASQADDYLHRSWQPALMVIAQVEEVSDVSNRLPPDVQMQLRTLDYETHLALVAFHGWRGKKGYGVQIECIEWQGDTVNAYAQFKQPEPGQSIYMLISPYHAVQAPKVGGWGRDITFNLIVDGTVVASRDWPKKVDLPGEVELPFETLEQTEWGSGTGREYEAGEPGLAVITRPEEAGHADDWASPDAQTQLQAPDYSAYVALVAFQGWQPSSGYGVQIDRITRLENAVNVYAQFSEPEPGTEMLDAITFPYHLVQVGKAEGWGQVTFNLVVDGMVLVSQTVDTDYPIP